MFEPVPGDLRFPARSGPDVARERGERVATDPAGDIDPTPDASVLVDAMRSGGEAAFEAFYRAFEPPIFRTALGLLHDRMTAEEVVCDTFLRAYAARDRLDPGRSPLPWLQRVAVNLALSALRRRRAASPAGWDHDGERRDGTAAEVEAPTSDPDGSLALRRGLERLPLGLRVPIVLRYLLEASVDEVAAMTGLPARTVRYRLRSGLRRLREELADEPDAVPDDAAAAPAPRAAR